MTDDNFKVAVIQKRNNREEYNTLWLCYSKLETPQLTPDEYLARRFNYDAANEVVDLLRGVFDLNAFVVCETEEVKQNTA